MEQAPYRLGGGGVRRGGRHEEVVPRVRSLRFRPHSGDRELQQEEVDSACQRRLGHLLKDHTEGLQDSLEERAHCQQLRSPAWNL